MTILTQSLASNSAHLAGHTLSLIAGIQHQLRTGRLMQHWHTSHISNVISEALCVESQNRRRNSAEARNVCPFEKCGFFTITTFQLSVNTWVTIMQQNIFQKNSSSLGKCGLADTATG